MQPPTPCPCCFGGIETSFERSAVVLVGVRLEPDVGRPGSSLAACAVRAASQTTPYWSIVGRRLIPRDAIYDAGDVEGRLETVLEGLEWIAAQVASRGKGLVVVGGSHTATLGVARAIARCASRPTILLLDAHLDAMKEYRGSRLASPCVALRVAEMLEGRGEVIHAGARVKPPAELERLEKLGVRIVDLDGLPAVLGEVIEESDWVHVSIDVDVMDPSLAPGATNPVPFGIEPSTVANIVYMVALKASYSTLDIVEYTPLYDPSQSTAYIIAQLVFEYTAGFVSSSRRSVTCL